MFCNLVTRLSNTQRGRQEQRSRHLVHKKTGSGTRSKVIRCMLSFPYLVCYACVCRIVLNQNSKFLISVNYVLGFRDSTVKHLYGRQEQKLHSAVYKKKELGDLIRINPACSLLWIKKHVNKPSKY